MAGIFDEDITGTPLPELPPTRPQAPGEANPERVIIATPPVAPPPANMFDADVTGAPAPTAAPGETNWAGYNKPFGEIKAADPSWTQAAKWKLMDVLSALGMPNYPAQHIGSGVIDAGKAVNPVMGTILSGADATYNAQRGNWGDAAWDTLGAAPALLGAKRLVQGMPKVPMADVPGNIKANDILALPERGRPDPYGMGPYGVRGPQPPVQPHDELLRASSNAYRDTRYAPLEYHPNAMNDFTAKAKQSLEHPELGFSPEKAPLVHSTLDRWVDRMAYRNTPISAQDWDTLRQQLKGLEGADGVAGNHVVNWLDSYMANPPPGALLRGTPQDLLNLENQFAVARGNWRAGKTAQTVEKEIDRADTRAGSRYSGGNLGNMTRQRLDALVTTDAGENKFVKFAQPDEVAAVIAASKGDPTTNTLRAWSNRLGGGGGIGQSGLGVMSGSAATTAAHLFGADPYSAMAIGTGTGLAVGKGGATLRQIANDRTVRAAEEAANLIRRNSPEYAARVRATPDITDPRAMLRDAITYALIPQAAQQSKSIWDQAHVPYENREQP